jgi:uncharacterized protein
MTARFYVDGWDPSYSSPMDPAEAQGPTGESTAQLLLDVEVAAASWTGLGPPPALRAPDTVRLVDGVRRIDARVWAEDPDGTLHPGLAASYAAGVVRCDLRKGSADVVASVVERGLFTPSPHAQDLAAASTTYPVRRAAGDLAALSQAVQGRLRALEADVSGRGRGGDEDDLLVLDGPLHGRAQLPRALGYVKTHRVQYLPAEQTACVTRLRPGQRCPVFLLGTHWHRYTWYLRLPGPPGSPWAGIVRVEASADLPRGEVVRLADLSAVTLPRFASSPYKDPRAPQNLIPIGGLERRLRGMLGDSRLLLRSLTAAARATAA